MCKAPAQGICFAIARHLWHNLHEMIQGKCEKCEDKGDTHGIACIVRKLIFDRDFKGRSKVYVTRKQALDAAVRALEGQIERERNRRTKMSETQLIAAKGKKQLDLSAIDNFMVRADINSMNDEQINHYIRKLCELVAINPITRPFDIMIQRGKKIIYANKGCAEQLRNIWGISIRIVKREVIDGVYTVTVAAQMGDRVDESTGCVWIEGVKGEERANAMMKAETKGKRRVTLSICGLNMPDDSEVESIPGARRSPLQMPSEAQLKRLFAISKKCNITHEDLRLYMEAEFNKSSSKELTLPEYDQLIDNLESGKAEQQLEAQKKIEPIQPEPFKPELVLEEVEPEADVPWAKYRDPKIVK